MAIYYTAAGVISILTGILLLQLGHNASEQEKLKERQTEIAEKAETDRIINQALDALPPSPELIEDRYRSEDFWWNVQYKTCQDWEAAFHESQNKGNALFEKQMKIWNRRADLSSGPDSIYRAYLRRTEPILKRLEAQYDQVNKERTYRGRKWSEACDELIQIAEDNAKKRAAK